MAEKTITREEWLLKIVGIATRELFQPAGYTVPTNIRVSCGFTSKGSKGVRIGECWSQQSSKDGTFEIFISPKLDDPSRVTDVLVHEVVHAVVGLEAKHGKLFKQCATKIGLEGKMTATVASAELNAKIKRWLERVPAYPHKELGAGLTTGPAKQSTRLLKIMCPGCGYVARTTTKWVETGLPTCHCGTEFVEGTVDVDSDED
jgi:hypothetical protein